jgi:hypothetical protein
MIPTIKIIDLIVTKPWGSIKRIEIEQKIKMQLIIIVFNFVVIVPVSMNFFALPAKILLLSNHIYNRGEDLANAQRAIKTKTVVGKPGTITPIAPIMTHSTPSPTQQILLISDMLTPMNNINIAINNTTP